MAALVLRVILSVKQNQVSFFYLFVIGKSFDALFALRNKIL